MRWNRPNLTPGGIVLVATAQAMLASVACGQLAPERTYNGIGKPLRVRVKTAVDAVGPFAVQLIQPGAGGRTERVEITEADRNGTVDLAAMFPGLWSATAPKFTYAQLLVGDDRVGPAVALQPMVTPTYAPRLDRSGAPMFIAEKDRPKVYSGVRAYIDQYVELETSCGTITLGLRPEAAPNTCWNFRELVEGGLYTDVPVHRVASLSGKKEPDIVQTGDPNGTGQGGPGYSIDLEPSSIAHDFGVVTAARFTEPNSAGSQFMICLNREGTAYMDGRYTAFAVVLDVGQGAQAVRTIAATPVGPDNRPLDPPVIRSARLIDAAPYGLGPKPAKDPLKVEKER
ncbi:MAG: peptidylprolyl isomerase [Phycisphaerales bacterium]|nr:peptidylprolyl isomerase [Phycisphaerales bacterium]